MSTETKKKSPNLSLRDKIGNHVIGEVVKRGESSNYPGTFYTILKVEYTDGTAKLAKKEVELEEGDTVFLNETRWLNKFMSERKVGDRVKITYTGEQAAKSKGFKPTITYDMEVL